MSQMKLTDFFRDELAYIKSLAQETAEQDPEFKKFLNSVTNEKDLEFLFEHFAFLMAKIRDRTESAFPEITQNVLARVWPMPIHPIPASTILQFQPQASGEIHPIKRGAQAIGITSDQTACHFAIVHDLAVLPLKLLKCRLANNPSGCTITLDMQWSGMVEDNRWQTLPFSFYLGSDQKIAGLLQLWFQQYLTKISVQTKGYELKVANHTIKPLTPTAENLVLPLKVPPFWRLQLLQEYFYLPHISDFLIFDATKDLSEIDLQENNTFSLIFQFNQPLMTEKPIDESAFQLNCVPAINVFSDTTAEILFQSGQSEYILPVTKNQQIFEINDVYSPLESKSEKRSNERGDRVDYYPVTEFTASQFDPKGKIFYQTILSHNVIGEAQNTLNFIDGHGDDVTQFSYNSFVCATTATNGDKCQLLAIGDISLPTESIGGGVIFTNITVPSDAIPPLIDSHRHWEIISHLSLSPLFLRDLQAIKQLITDLNFHAEHNVAYQQRCEKQLSGIVSVASNPIDWVFKAVMKRGIEMMLTLDPNYFADDGEMYRFGFTLAQVLPFCISSNNFLMMHIVNAETQQTWSIAPIGGSRDQL